MTSFAAQVKQFTTDAKQDTGLIFATAIQKLETQMKLTVNNGGMTPIDTGNLRDSILTTTVAMPQVDTEEKEYTPVAFSIGPEDLGRPVYMGVQAAYGPRIEFGFVGTDSLGRTYNQTGHYFVTGSGAKWQQFVTEAESQFGTS
jgi:hypothetical protein